MHYCHYFALLFIIMHHFSLLCTIFHYCALLSIPFILQTPCIIENPLYHRVPVTGTASQVHPSQVKSSLTVTMEDEIGELRRLIVSKLEELILSLTLGPDSVDSVTINELESIQGSGP